MWFKFAAEFFGLKLFVTELLDFGDELSGHDAIAIGFPKSVILYT